MTTPPDDNTIKRFTDAAFATRGPDHARGWEAREAGTAFDPTESPDWQLGWRECDEVTPPRDSAAAT
jgi:hypothetical protein